MVRILRTIKTIEHDGTSIRCLSLQSVKVFNRINPELLGNGVLARVAQPFERTGHSRRRREQSVHGVDRQIHRVAQIQCTAAIQFAPIDQQIQHVIGEAITERNSQVGQFRHRREQSQQALFGQFSRRKIQFGHLTVRPVHGQHRCILNV